ncbi:MAG: aminotransferase class I/II-fold pyridoxal phosphate-dependent enzyme, partial [Bdellovibrionales bacterium]|nr:aminotransferase class I/II-fold pyridoxal phosphate-dependent enzyme [Oligoflexia bacterium]
SKEGILYLSMALLNPGDEVLIPNPGYPAYASVANLLNAKIIEYSLTEENHWFPDFEALEKLDLSRCKLMWVNYPHMPTGKAAQPELFQRLVQFAKSKKILLCNDNPYSLVLNPSRPLSLLEFDSQYEVSVELNSLSKSFNMAGWRVGMILGAKDLVEAVLRVKSNVDSGMFLAVQKAAIEALKAGSEWHVERNAVYLERRKIIFKIFDALNFHYEEDQVGLFVWAKAPSELTSLTEFLDRLLEEAHVFLTPGMIFGSNGDRFARASLCAPHERLSLALERVEGFCK